MNILPHKSWHVYNKANVERVRKDEAKAAEEAKKKKDRADLAESEARLNLLRQRANTRLPPEDQLLREPQPIEHINLFHDFEQKLERNEEAEAERKVEEEKFDKRFTMYLDKGTEKADEPWYVKTDRKEEKYIDPYKFKSKQEQKRKVKDTSNKDDDPLHFIKKKLQQKNSNDRRDKKKSHRERHENDKSNNNCSNSSPTMEELRAKRYARERKEKARLQNLYLDHKEDQEDVIDERKRGYNSQFNREETELANSKRRRRQ
ncbi:hypothetical protein BDF20DRAFT_854572 [Mycotypha africana]|uniref:uncharacterized protein n=1 Tax=Mycotypha africana TaxID=64632 RepID=UPI0023014DCC|nr:uncharacterized protein BDF20DRAFT_854572 [Mycotypha africana]KAI8988228.1 hypothetical protein BDF20DRAFT_854572 [Mycotypha africana]